MTVCANDFLKKCGIVFCKLFVVKLSLLLFVFVGKQYNNFI